MTGKIELTEDNVDDYVELWHRSYGMHMPMQKFLGLTDEQYSLFATRPSELWIALKENPAYINLENE